MRIIKIFTSFSSKKYFCNYFVIEVLEMAERMCLEISTFMVSTEPNIFSYTEIIPKSLYVHLCYYFLTGKYALIFRRTKSREDSFFFVAYTYEGCARLTMDKE